MMNSDVLAFFLGILGVMFLVIFIIAIFIIIGQWKLFTKAGEEGWKSLIPFYNQYTLCKIVGVSPWWILIVVAIAWLGVMIEPVAALGTVASIYFKVLLSISLARSFGKSDGFGIMTIFFSPICYLILAFGDSKYLGAKPMKDVILSSFNNNNSNNSYSNNTYNNQNISSEISNVDDVVSNDEVNTDNNDNKDNSNFGFCSACGYKLEHKSNFCPKCGNRL